MLKIYKGDIEITMKDQWSIKTKKGELFKDRISKILIYDKDGIQMNYWNMEKYSSPSYSFHPRKCQIKKRYKVKK